MEGSQPRNTSPADWDMVHQTHYATDSNSDLTTAIIFGLAEVKGVEPTELTEPNLYDCVDAAALEDSFFGPDVRRDSRDATGQAEFMYGEYRVVVQNDGWILIHEPIKG